MNNDQKTFELLESLCYKSEPDSRLEKIYLKKMAKKAKTFEEWESIHCRAKTGSSLEKRALRKMAKKGTFEKWKYVYIREQFKYISCRSYRLESKSSSEKRALKEMAKKGTLQEWKSICYCSNGPLKILASEMILKLSKKDQTN